MTETVRYLETRLVAPHPPGFSHQQKQCSFLRAIAGAHTGHKKQIHPTPIEHIGTHENYVYNILFALPSTQYQWKMEVYRGPLLQM